MDASHAWLAELEMDPIHSLINNLYDQSGRMEEATLDEQLLATFFDTVSPLGNVECNTIEQYISTPPISDTSENHDDNNSDNNNDNDNIIVSTRVQKSQSSKSKQERKKQVVASGAKRKRQPSQVQDHIMAERKRREVLSQMFITLSTMVPGLKKIDKTSVLGEAIKHMKALQEKVKELESVVAKNAMESEVVVKKLKLIVDKGNNNDDNVCSWTVEDYCGNGGSSDDDDNDNDNGGNNGGNSFSEIEVKVLGNKILLRIYCEKQKKILAKLFDEVHKHHLTIANFSVVPFENLALNITIVAQMERKFNKNVSVFVKALRNVLDLA